MRKIQLIGNVGKDATFHSTEKGGFISFSLATQTNKNDATLWVTCNKNGGENLAPHITKGTKLFVQGDFSLRTYTDKQGVQHTEPMCYVDFVEFCGSKTESQQSPNVPFANQQMAQRDRKSVV